MTCRPCGRSDPGDVLRQEEANLGAILLLATLPRRARDSAPRDASATGARFVHHVPGVGFVGDGSPPDPSTYGDCISGCAGDESSCIASCGSGGVF